MQRLLSLLPLVALTFCVSRNKKPLAPIAQPLIVLKTDSLVTYDSAKRKVISVRDSIYQHYLGQRIDGRKDIEDCFTQAVVNQLISQWYGTPWDFNGMTQQPRQGQIACGYFVSTVLRDAGFKLQRIKLAQSAASVIVQQVTDKATIRHFSLQPVQNVDSAVKEMGPGLYVAGLDFHVGFLFNDGLKVYFIHSNYIGREGVVRESITGSRAFANSKYRIIGKVSTSSCLLKNWLYRQD